MIALLTGTIADVEANTIILDVGGVGYKVSVPVSTLTEIGEVGAKATLRVHTYVREEEISLYGFSDALQQKAFQLLLGVTGIGPKVALSILSAMDVGTLSNAVVTEDTKTLIRVPGLGLKTAQRLVLELKDKLSLMALEARAVQGAVIRPARDGFLEDVIEGLVNLGYNRNEARRAADRAVREDGAASSPPAALRAALNILTGGR